MKLNLPPFIPRIRKAPEDSPYEYDVYDPYRCKWLRLTPEEMVRQAFNAFLTGHKGVPPSLMANEVKLHVYKTNKRSDTVVFRRNLQPLLICEYKRPSVQITQRVFSQIARYNITFEAPFLAVSNGLVTYCVHYDHAGGSYEFLKTFPTYDEMLAMADGNTEEQPSFDKNR